MGVKAINLNTIKDIFDLLSVVFLPFFALFISLVNIIKKSIKSKGITIGLKEVFVFYALIPILFILSRTGGLTSSTRYIANLWPGFVILYTLGFYYLFTKRSLLIKVVVLILLGNLLNRNLLLYKSSIQNIKNRTFENTAQIQAAEYLIENGIKGCYARYWDAFPITWESDYKVICSPSLRYENLANEAPFYTQKIDKMLNPAFIFLTQKEVDKFHRKWIGKEFKIIKEEKVADFYYIFITERTKNSETY